MSDLKTVQALVSAVELAENYSDHPEYERTMTNALTLGRALIAQMQRDAVQPVAWRWSESSGKHWFDWTTDWTHHDKAKAMGCLVEYAAPQPAPEPLSDEEVAALIVKHGLMETPWPTQQKLADFARAAAIRESSKAALSDERIINHAHRQAYRFKMMDENHGCTTYLFNEPSLLRFARAIEAAHGIKGEA